MKFKVSEITRKLCIVLIPTLLATGYCDDPPDIRDSKLMYVSANGGLRMREAPNTNAARITTIPDRSPVLVLEETGEEIELSGKTGKWVRVSYEKYEGWVFGGFLTLSAESEASAEIPSEWRGTWVCLQPSYGQDCKVAVAYNISAEGITWNEGTQFAVEYVGPSTREITDPGYTHIVELEMTTSNDSGQFWLLGKNGDITYINRHGNVSDMTPCKRELSSSDRQDICQIPDAF